MNEIVGRGFLLSYSNFSERFIIYADSGKAHLGGLISQNWKPVVFYSHKLTPAQINYTITERELLSIVETSTEFHPILLGHCITVFTDHKNLIFDNFTTERVLCWRLVLK